MNWAELLNRMAHWQRTQFPKTTVKGAAEHLMKEAMEVAVAPQDPEEWADVFHLAIQGGTKAAGSLNKFKAVVEKKLIHNDTERVWPAEPDKDNVYEHVKPHTKHDRNFNG